MLPEVTAEDELERRLAAVAARYDEPHRRYHGPQHLVAVLADIDRLLGSVVVDDPTAVRLAALFHDAIYDPRSSLNEERSAELARTELEGLVDPSTVDAVCRLVLATAAHAPSADDEAVLLDADLAVLAADTATYDAYAAGVRAEYAHVDDLTWRIGRGAVLRSFLDRPRIFTTPASAGRERVARANLERELRSLKA
jgi:predicted metal-dependent HD superfamily phosphohydrolase